MSFSLSISCPCTAVFMVEIGQYLFVCCGVTIPMEDIGMIIVREHVGVDPVITGITGTDRLAGDLHHRKLFRRIFYLTEFSIFILSEQWGGRNIDRPGEIDIGTCPLVIAVGTETVERMLITLRAEEELYAAVFRFEFRNIGMGYSGCGVAGNPRSGKKASHAVPPCIVGCMIGNPFIIVDIGLY